MRCEGYMLMTRNIEASKQFYTDVIGAAIILDIGTHVVFEEGFSLLIESDWKNFAGLENAPLHYRHNTGQLVFEVEDFEQALASLRTLDKSSIVHGPKQHHWGRWAVRLRDPDGHIIEIGENMTVVVKRFLRQGLSIEETAKISEFPIDFVRKCRDAMIDENK